MRYRFFGASSAKVTAHAPGHKFTASGRGIEGEIELTDDSITHLAVSFPLARLDAGDPLSNRELKKFLGLDRGPIAKAELIAPMALSPNADGELEGTGQIRFSIEGRKTEVTLSVIGTPPAGQGRFGLTFTQLGFQPPKLLFLKVKDRLDVEVEARLEAEGEE